jgi:O-antigen ligase/polysaccharide polymerase Wzy-like membrane protein
MASTMRQHAGAGLVAASIVIAAFAQGLFDPTGYAAASIVIWAAVVAGLVGRALPSTPIGTLAALAGLCLAATAVLATASVGWASDQGRAFDEAVRVSFYLGLFVLAACTANRVGRAQWVAGLATGLGAVTVVSLFAYLQPGVLNSGNVDIPNAAGRLSYPIGYWNGAAALLAAAAILLAYGGVRAPTRLLRSMATAIVALALLGIWLANSRGGAAAVVIAGAVLVAASPDRTRQLVSVAIGAGAAAVLIVASEQMHALTSGVVDSAMRADGDRMSALCVAVAAIAGAVAWWADGRRPRVRLSRRLGFALGAIAIAGVVAGAIAADPAKRLREFESAPTARAGIPVGAADLSSNGRWQFWGEALDAFESNPIGGVGAGGYEDWWGQHASVALFVRNAHSLPLQQAAELGIPGIVLFLGFVAAVGLAAGRRFAAGLEGDSGILAAIVVAGAVGASVDWTWEIPAVFGPAVVCAALLLASAPSRPLARDGYWLGLGTVAAAWIAMVAAGLVVLTELEMQKSRDAAAAGRIGEATDRARAAKTVQPWSSEPYTQLAELEAQSGDISQALTDLRQAEDRDSEDWRLPLIEASLLQRRGDGAAAHLAYQRAKSLSPLPLVSVVFPPSQG